MYIRRRPCRLARSTASRPDRQGICPRGKCSETRAGHRTSSGMSCAGAVDQHHRMPARSARNEPLGEAVIAGLDIGWIVGHRHGRAAEGPRAHALDLDDFFGSGPALRKGLGTRRDGQQECGREQKRIVRHDDPPSVRARPAGGPFPTFELRAAPADRQVLCARPERPVQPEGLFRQRGSCPCRVRSGT